MKTILKLEVIGRTESADGYGYILSMTGGDKFAIGETITAELAINKPTLQSILDGIYKVFGFSMAELKGDGRDTIHTYARKVYARLRTEMGIKSGDIGRELGKKSASVAYYLSDDSVKLQEYCDAVRNGSVYPENS